MLFLYFLCFYIKLLLNNISYSFCFINTIVFILEKRIIKIETIYSNPIKGRAFFQLHLKISYYKGLLNLLGWNITKHPVILLVYVLYSVRVLCCVPTFFASDLNTLSLTFLFLSNIHQSGWCS